jgi:NAD(P)H dehydrogenase (quinone)
MTTSVPLIGVTGSTGQLGSRVATRLATLGRPQRLLVRDITRAPQLSDTEIVQAPYEDVPLMRDALSGVQVLFLISGYQHITANRH